jgi:hypothetical protein
MKYDGEMGSRAMIYAHTKFHKYWFRDSKVGRETAQTHRQHGDRISHFRKVEVR